MIKTLAHDRMRCEQGTTTVETKAMDGDKLEFIADQPNQERHNARASRLQGESRGEHSTSSSMSCLPSRPLWSSDAHEQIEVRQQRYTEFFGT